jgi:hypothetical protein
MKNFLVGILLLTTVAFAGLYFHQNEAMRKAEADVAELKKNATDLEARLDQQEKNASSLRDRLRDANESTAVIPATPAAETPEAIAATNVASAGTNDMKSSLASMFKNPAMRDMVRTQQKAMFATMVDKNFKDLFASLNLSPEQTASLKDLFTQKMQVDAEAGMDLLTSDLDAAGKAALTQKSKDDKAAIDDEIKSALGDAGFAQYQAYEKTMPERMVFGQFQDQMAGSSTALSAAQQQQLMQAMSDERSSFKFTTDYSDQSKFDGDYASAFSDEKMAQYFTESEQLNQRYVARAQTILSPEQLDAYQKFLAAQTQMQQAGMKMAASMFAPKPK